MHSAWYTNMLGYALYKAFPNISLALIQLKNSSIASEHWTEHAFVFQWTMAYRESIYSFCILLGVRLNCWNLLNIELSLVRKMMREKFIGLNWRFTINLKKYCCMRGKPCLNINEWGFNGIKDSTEILFCH